MKKRDDMRRKWSKSQLRSLRKQKMYAGGEVRGRGSVTGWVRQCLKPGQLDGLGVEHVRIYGGKTLRAHKHLKTEAFLIITSGHGRVILNSKTVRVKRGDLLSIPPRTPHGFVAGQHPLEFIAIQRPGVYQPGKWEDLVIVPERKQKRRRG